MIQVEAIRIPTVDYPSEDRCHFPTRSPGRLMRAPAHFARDQRHFESKHALILTYRPLEPKKTAFSR